MLKKEEIYCLTFSLYLSIPSIVVSVVRDFLLNWTKSLPCWALLESIQRLYASSCLVEWHFHCQVTTCVF